MILHIPNVLTPEEVTHARRMLEAAEWVDGKVTAGHQSARAKNNQQLSEDSACARELGQRVLSGLERNSLFFPRPCLSKFFRRYSIVTRAVNRSAGT